MSASTEGRSADRAQARARWRAVALLAVVFGVGAIVGGALQGLLEARPAEGFVAAADTLHRRGGARAFERGRRFGGREGSRRLAPMELSASLREELRLSDEQERALREVME
ncbi:MAG: hypothetical protein D6701_00505, partial [Gemmatimonadetes bacterium]